MDIQGYWQAVLQQDAVAIKTYFHGNAYVNWHCSNEHFTVEEFIQANCEYPGEWEGVIERQEEIGDTIITVTHVYTKDRGQSFHVTSFIQISNDKIMAVDEYWGDDTPAPQWRLEKHLGTTIRDEGCIHRD